LDALRRKNDLVRKHATEAGRDETLIERAVSWPGDGTSADAYADQGATLFIMEIHPTDEGHDLSPLKAMGPASDGSVLIGLVFIGPSAIQARPAILPVLPSSSLPGPIQKWVNLSQSPAGGSSGEGRLLRRRNEGRRRRRALGNDQDRSQLAARPLKACAALGPGG
jgi:hypothetical protein